MAALATTLSCLHSGPATRRHRPSRCAPIPIELYVGQVHHPRRRAQRVAVGNGKVIQATALDGGQVLVIPEAAGQSTLHLWGKDGTETSSAISVAPADANRLLDEIRAMLGESSRVRAHRRRQGGAQGSELSEEEAARMTEIARRYPQVVNLISRVGLEADDRDGRAHAQIRRDLLEDIGVAGTAACRDRASASRDLQRSRAFQSGGAARGRLETRTRVAPFATVLGLASSITSVINLLVQNGDAVVLAEPRLSCRSGGSARFIAGGELPVPFASGLGTVSVGFKEYGVKFDVSPVASESGVIAAKIATEISAINFEIQVQDVPGLLKRRAETEVNLRENETLVIAGLLTEESSKAIDRVPGLGEIPILGNVLPARVPRSQDRSRRSSRRASSGWPARRNARRSSAAGSARAGARTGPDGRLKC